MTGVRPNRRGDTPVAYSGLADCWNYIGDNLGVAEVYFMSD